MNKKKKKSSIHLDVRVVLFQLMATSMLAFLLPGEKGGLLLLILCLILGVASKKIKLSFGFTIIYVILFIIAEKGPILLGSTIQYFFLRMLIVAFSMFLFFSTTQIAELTSALQNMKLPQIIIIPLIIVLRFLPSIKQDAIYIYQGMKTRQIGLSPIRIIFHPLITYERFIVPLLMRVLATATELSASAESRGISFPCKKTQYKEVYFNVKDSCVLLLMIVFYTITIIYTFTIGG